MQYHNVGLGKDLRPDQLREMRRYIERMVCSKEPLFVEKRSPFSFAESREVDIVNEKVSSRKRLAENSPSKSKRLRHSNSFLDDEAEVSDEQSDEEMMSENGEDR